MKDKDDYLVSSPKEAIRHGRKYPETYFAGVIAQKGYVGFYFMPVQADEQSRIFSPELLALLKGKSCFHFKRLDGGAARPGSRRARPWLRALSRARLDRLRAGGTGGRVR